MVKTTNPRKTTKETHKPKQTKHDEQNKQQLPSWAVMKNFLTCKHLDVVQHHHQQQTQPIQQKPNNKKLSKDKKIRCSGSLCNNTKVTQRPADSVSPDILRKKQRQIPGSSSASNNHDGSNRSLKSPVLNEISNHNKNHNNNNNNNNATNGTLMKNSSSSIANYSIKGMPFRRLSGCYECRMVVDPVMAFTKDPSLRATICSCPHCGEIFMKPENLEVHQAVRHAVSELGSEDTSKNIVEIIFQSSWLGKQNPVCQIDRILKVHNTQKTINKFEEYRDSIKSKANKHPKKHPRCIADGNELLRFHSTTFMCSLGISGSSNLCNSIPNCSVCGIIKSGFKFRPSNDNGLEVKGILTTATSGLAHDLAEGAQEEGEQQERRAMLVCRVIAGRVKKSMEREELEEYDSVAGVTGVYSNLDELYVFNPKAILPCFVVVYRGF